MSLVRTMDDLDDMSSSAKFIVLDKIRTTLNFLRKANVFNEVGQVGYYGKL